MTAEGTANDEVVDRRSLRFTRVVLANWRNFTHVEAPLQRRLFLVGPNASGKSNFIDAFRFLSDVVTVGGGFQAAVARRGGVSMIRSFSARRHPSVRITVVLGTDASPHEWEYDLTFGQDNQRRPEITSEVVRRRGFELVRRPDAEDEQDHERLRQTSLEQVNVNRSFRDVADFLESVRYLHVVPQLVREPDRSAGRVNDPFGGDFLEQIARATKRTRDTRLRRISEALRVAVPQLEELELTSDVKGAPHIRGRYRHWKNGAWQTEEHFSDGTLRLLGLLWALTEGSGPLLLEEPELSLHPEVVRHIPQMFAQVQRRTGRQLIVSSHSPEILDDPGIGLDEVMTLTTAAEGTRAVLASEQQDIVSMREAGLSLAEILTSVTRPQDAEQLAFFGR
jgi:predicted ATPase